MRKTTTRQRKQGTKATMAEAAKEAGFFSEPKPEVRVNPKTGKPIDDAVGDELKRLMGITPEDFIRVWEKADTIEEVAEYFDASVGWTGRRARKYRNKGVSIRHFPITRTRQPLDVDSLNALVESLKEEADGDVAEGKEAA